MLCIRAHLKTVTTGKTIITQRRLTDNQFFFPPTYFYTLLHFDCDNVNLSNLIGGYTFLSVGTNRFAELKKKELFKKKISKIHCNRPDLLGIFQICGEEEKSNKTLPTCAL